jgi:hypothetical protein
VAHRVAEAFDLGECPRFGGSGGFVDDRVGGALDECNDVAGQSTLIDEGLNDHSEGSQCGTHCNWLDATCGDFGLGEVSECVDGSAESSDATSSE